MKISDVCKIFSEIAPLHLAQEWDHVGLIAGHEEQVCQTILLTIDLTDAVLEEAIAHRADLIMAYHPPLFRPIFSLCAQSREMDALVWKAIRNNISLYTMHTALDAALDGTCDALAQICGAVDLMPFEYDPAKLTGLGRIGTLNPPTMLSDLIKRLKSETPTSTPVMIGAPQATIHKIAVLVGAAGLIPLKLNLNASDCIITGEIRHHEALTILRHKTNAIALGHWASERPGLFRLAELLRNKMDAVKIRVSQNDRDPFIAI